MSSFLLAFLRGTVALTLMVVNTVFWCIPLYSAALAKALAPNKAFRRRIADLWQEKDGLVANLLRSAGSTKVGGFPVP